MQLSELLNYILGGGLIATIIGLITLRATVRKANAEADKAKAEAETVRIDNAEHATQILIDNIVKPLRTELNDTRKDLQATKREMARLRKAVNDANRCRHHDECPVLDGLRRQEGGECRDTRQSKDDDDKGQHRARSPDNAE